MLSECFLKAYPVIVPIKRKEELAVRTGGTSSYKAVLVFFKAQRS